MRLNVKTMIVILILLLVGVAGIGWGVHLFLQRLAQTQPNVSKSASASIGEPSRNPVIDPSVKMLMTKFAINQQGAVYLAGAKTQVVSQSTTSAQLAITFPDGATADETITIQPDQKYTPTPAELEHAAQTGPQVYNVRFSSAPDGPDKTRITLQYFVPYSSVPEDLQQKIRQQSSSSLFQLVPSVWAQDGGGGGGMGVSSGFGILTKTAGALYNIFKATQKTEQHDNWMNQLDKLRDCAENPTNPVTQKAYQDNPGYRDQTLAGIDSARSTVEQATAVRFLNQEASVASGLLGPAGMLTAPVAMWNDSTLKDVAQRQVDDISKSVAKCDPVPPPGGSDGTIVYHMHREGYLEFAVEDRLLQGSFDLVAGPGGTLSLRGSGTFQGSANSPRFGTSSACKGMSQLDGSGGLGTLHIEGSPTIGDCQFIDHGKMTHLSPSDSDNAFACYFTNVDLVNGGSYEVQAAGEESRWAKCKLELTPRQK